jgi:hypothetical protein
MSDSAEDSSGLHWQFLYFHPEMSDEEVQEVIEVSSKKKGKHLV